MILDLSLSKDKDPYITLINYLSVQLSRSFIEFGLPKDAVSTMRGTNKPDLDFFVHDATELQVIMASSRRWSTATRSLLRPLSRAPPASGS